MVLHPWDDSPACTDLHNAISTEDATFQVTLLLFTSIKIFFKKRGHTVSLHDYNVSAVIAQHLAKSRLRFGDFGFGSGI